MIMINKDLLVRRLHEAYPYAADEYIETKAEALLNCNEELHENINEWISKKPFTDIEYRGKYTLDIVLQIRGAHSDSDIISAILSLNDYLTDEEKEELIWRKRR